MRQVILTVPPMGRSNAVDVEVRTEVSIAVEVTGTTSVQNAVVAVELAGQRVNKHVLTRSWPQYKASGLAWEVLEPVQSNLPKNHDLSFCNSRERDGGALASGLR